MKFDFQKFIKQIIIMIFSVIATGFGLSICIKASLGIGAYDAAAMSLSNLLAIKIGSIAMTINICFVILQILLLKREFRPIQFLQIGISVLLGTVVNFFVYKMFGELEVSNYIIRIIMLLIGYVICALAISLIMSINVVSMPLEGFCLALSNKISKKLGRIRQSVDIISICLVLTLTLIFKIDLTLREGTIIGMLIFGPMLDIFMKVFKPKLISLDLI